jgi:hypothetical protein
MRESRSSEMTYEKKNHSIHWTTLDNRRTIINTFSERWNKRYFRITERRRALQGHYNFDIYTYIHMEERNHVC